MNKISNNSYSGQSVTLDNMHFDNCDFDDYKLVFRGTALFGMVNCRFYGCQWMLDGNAAITIQFLKLMYRGFGDEGRQLVESLLQTIQADDSLIQGSQQP
jgi:hypothetical protein